MTEQGDSKPADVVVRGDATGFLQEVVSGNHHLRADEPISVGGSDAAPGPYDYLLIALGVCTSMTVGLYARRKQFPLENITVSLRHARIHAQDCEECETKEGMLDRIDTSYRVDRTLDGRATRQVDRDRRQMPRPSHAQIGDRHPPQRRVAEKAISHHFSARGRSS